MKSRKMLEWERKIRNGKRKQAEAVQREKEKVWDRLKQVDKPRFTTRSVTATTRTLRTGWKIEAAEDIKCNFHPSVRDIIIDNLVKETVAKQERAWEEKVKQQLKNFLAEEYKTWQDSK